MHYLEVDGGKVSILIFFSTNYKCSRTFWASTHIATLPIITGV